MGFGGRGGYGARTGLTSTLVRHPEAVPAPIDTAPRDDQSLEYLGTIVSMGEEEPEVPTRALEDVAYLARSVNRVRILGVLTNRSATRRELAEVTGTSRTTLDRIVNELEDRGWAKRTLDGTYTATPQGTQLQRQFQPFLDSVVAIRKLGNAVAWLPTEELTVGLEHFADAIVQRPERDDPVETIDLMVEMVDEATRHRAFTHLVPPEPLSEAIVAFGSFSVVVFVNRRPRERRVRIAGQR